MFTGIIQVLGVIQEVRPARGGALLEVQGTLPGEPLALGESIAVSGPCLTVQAVRGGGFAVFASEETLRRTTLQSARAGRPVNLERALRLGDRLGGHLVTGHVDGIGRLQQATPVGEARQLAFRMPPDLRPLIAQKGSIAVDGVSLTVNEVRGDRFTVMVIPHTLAATTLGHLRVGDEVNLEADPLARYVHATLAGSGGETPSRLEALLGLDSHRTDGPRGSR
ncbi:MAG TPA: riboflavin synthase [Myxococcota bacterium]|nr:riboflavin synthase [Myxococcota bacterium]HQK49916.1 riboflavin synthase [Myxococcota bacterium]